MNWFLLIFAYGCLFALGLTDNIRGPLFPDILESLHLTDSQGALFFSLSSFSSLFGSLAARWMQEHWGTVKSIRISLQLLCVGLLGIGLSHNLPMLLSVSVIHGFSYGSIGVMQNLLVKEAVPISLLRRALSGLHSMYGIASLMSPLVVVMIYRMKLLWGDAFVAVAFVPLFLSFFAYSKVHRAASPQRVRDFVLSRRELIHQLFFGLIVALYVISEVMISTRLALYMRRVHQATPERASFYVMLFFICLFCGRLLFTLYHFKWNNKLLLSGISIVSFFTMAAGLWLHPFFLGLTAFIMAPFFPAAMAYAAEIFEEKADSAISYSISMMSLFIVIMHWGIGYLTDLMGIQLALHTGLISLALVFCLIMIRQKVFAKV